MYYYGPIRPENKGDNYYGKMSSLSDGICAIYYLGHDKIKQDFKNIFPKQLSSFPAINFKRKVSGARALK